MTLNYLSDQELFVSNLFSGKVKVENIFWKRFYMHDDKVVCVTHLVMLLIAFLY